VTKGLFALRDFALLGVALTGAPAIAEDWTLWGGPQRDFQIETSEPLADSWLAGGARKLWKRQLGEGYSAIAVRGNTLYTMYRREAAFWQIFKTGQEVIVALDASTGETKWQFAYDEPFRSAQGPRSSRHAATRR